MTGRKRVYIITGALVLIGLVLLAVLSLFRSGGAPQPDISDDLTAQVLAPSSTPRPTQTRPPTESATQTEHEEPNDTPGLTPSRELSAADDPTDTPLPTRTVSLSTTFVPPVSETSATQESLLDTPSGGGVVTAVSQTPPPTPIEIAFAPILIRSDVSGDVIGDGTLRVFAPVSVQPPQTVRVELELNLDNLYITPTPPGSAGTPVPRSTQVASPTGATPTPYAPIVTDQGLPIYQRMGATLLCAVESFAGCDGQRDPTQAKLITSQKTTWSWILRPAEGASGIQDLRIEVWITQFNLDGRIEYLDIPDAQYPLRIEIVPAGGVSPLLALIVGGVVLVGAWVLLRRGRGAQKMVSATPSPRAAVGSIRVPMVFISYRRGSSWGQARSIEQSLRKRGANVFIDVDDINEGKFAETIQKAIADCDFFLPVLAPGTLDSIWVRREIAHAIQLKKTIVPLLVDGFTLDETSVPPDITEIASHNAIRVLPEFYEEAMDRLAKRFLRLE